MIEQRSIVELPFNLPQGVMNHPGIILSTNEAIEQEQAFIAVMLTSEEKIRDRFTFKITNDMCTKNLKVNYCQARLHIISFFSLSDIISNWNYNNKLKEPFFYDLLDAINENAFGN